jgi:hypothetical protein
MQNEALPVRIEGPVKVEAEVKATMVGNNGKSAYEIALAHGFVGTEEEWLESLKVKMPNLSGVVSALQGKNILINSGTLEAILSAIVHALAEQPYAPLTFNEPRKGDTEVRVSGQDGFKVRVSGSTEAVEIQSGSATIRIQPYGTDDIYLEYLNLIEHVVSTVKIKGLIEFNPETATEILPKQFYGRSDLEGELNCPNVVKVGALAFAGTDHNIINLPKATDIDRDAFAGSSFAVINIPAFVWSGNNLNLQSSGLIRVNKITVSEESHPPQNVMMQKISLEVYNPDHSKKWNLYSEKWEKAEA